MPILEHAGPCLQHGGALVGVATADIRGLFTMITIIAACLLNMLPPLTCASVSIASNTLFKDVGVLNKAALGRDIGLFPMASNNSSTMVS